MPAKCTVSFANIVPLLCPSRPPSVCPVDAHARIDDDFCVVTVGRGITIVSSGASRVGDEYIDFDGQFCTLGRSCEEKD